MINRKIKSKINKKESLSAEELYEYFNYSESKNYFKNKNANDTLYFIVKHFDSILLKMSTHELSELLEKSIWMKKEETFFQALSTNSITIAEIINNLSWGDVDVGQALHNTLLNSKFAHIFFQKNFAQFYEKVNPLNFDTKSFFTFSCVDHTIKSEIQKSLDECILNETLKPEDICWYISELIYSENAQKKASFNKFKIAKELDDDVKKSVQEKISHEKAISLMKRTDSPIKLHEHFLSVGINDEKIDEIINSRIDSVVYEICNQEPSNGNGGETIKILLEELMRNEHVNLSDITLMGEGGYSTVFGIGSKAFKHGSKPRTYNIPHNSDKFLQPLLRTQISNASYIEIYEKVHVGATKDELYALYKDLRKQGLVWTDVTQNNAGRLIRDNKIYFEGIDTVDEASLGFEKNSSIKPSKAGDLVVIDLDWIFEEGDPNIEYPSSPSFFKEFEYKYKKELEALGSKEQSKNPQPKKPSVDPDI